MQFTDLEIAMMLLALKNYAKDKKHSRDQREDSYELLSRIWSTKAIKTTHLDIKIIMRALKYEKPLAKKQSKNSAMFKAYWKDLVTKLEDYDAQAVHMVKTLIARTNQDIRLANHHHVDFALDDLFSGLIINKKDATEDSKSIITSITLAKVANGTPFFEYKNHNTKVLYVIKSAIVAIQYELKHNTHHLTDLDKEYQIIRMHKLMHMQTEGYKYMINIFRPDNTTSKMKPVSANDFRQFATKLKDVIKNIDSSKVYDD